MTHKPLRNLTEEEVVELTKIASDMLLGQHTCEQRHRRGERAAHVHFDDVHRWGQRMARVLGEVRDAT